MSAVYDAKLTSWGKPSEPYGRNWSWLSVLTFQFYVYLQGTVYVCQNVHSYINYAVFLFFFLWTTRTVLVVESYEREWCCTKWLFDLFFFIYMQKKSENTQAPLRRCGWMCFFFTWRLKRRKINEGQPYIIPVSVPMEVSWNQSH